VSNVSVTTGASDELDASAVPEPTSIILLAMGIVGLLLARRPPGTEHRCDPRGPAGTAPAGIEESAGPSPATARPKPAAGDFRRGPLRRSRCSACGCERSRVPPGRRRRTGRGRSRLDPLVTDRGDGPQRRPPFFAPIGPACLGARPVQLRTPMRVEAGSLPLDVPAAVRRGSVPVSVNARSTRLPTAAPRAAALVPTPECQDQVTGWTRARCDRPQDPPRFPEGAVAAIIARG
jgi:hypothetical protein